MKKIPILLCIFSLLFLSTSLLSTSHAASINNKLSDLYAAADYPAIALLLEAEIDKPASEPTANHRNSHKKLYELYIMLAHVYAWKLDKFNDGLATYEKALELRREEEHKSQQKKSGPQMTMPAIEYLFVAGMYEQIKDYTRALEYYQKILPEIQAYNDALVKSGQGLLLGNDLTFLIQYAIDTIHLRQQSAKTYTPLTKKMDLMHECNPMILILMLSTVFPEQQYIFKNKAYKLENNNLDVESFIKNNPANTYSMLAEVCLLMSGLRAIKYDSTNQIPRAAEAFINKYPDSYLSLATRFLIAQISQQNGDTAKAQLYSAELKKTAKKRNIELIIEPDKKFATPDSTWEALRKAMSKGDIEAALSCHIPGDAQQKEIYTALGPAILKKIAADMKPIGKIRSDEQTAKYRANRMHKDIDTEITYYVYFVNILGEWKIESM